MTKAELLDAIRQCLYGDCEKCPLFWSVQLNGTRTRCRMELLYQAEQILDKKEEDE